MNKKYLIICDMQVDVIKKAGQEGLNIINPIVTEVMDGDYGYLFTTWLNGKDFCIRDTDGWKYCAQIVDAIQNVAISDGVMINCLEKETPLYTNWASLIRDPIEITVVGLNGYDSVLINALALKSLFPKAKVIVKKSCTAVNCIPSMNLYSLLTCNGIVVER